jgi:CheY-like chemotaxis protein
MDNASINVDDNEAKFTFLKSLCDYGKSLIEEMNKIFLEEKNPKCEFFYVSDVIEFVVKMFKFKKYREGKKFKIRSDIKFSYNKAINSINETALKMVLVNLLTNAYKFTEQGEIIVSAVEIPEKQKIYIYVKDTGVGFDVNQFVKKGIFKKYEKNEKYNTDGSGLGMEIVQDILNKFNSELKFYSDPKFGGSIFYFELTDTYPYNEYIDLKKIMPYSMKKLFDDINSGKCDLYEGNKKYDHKNFVTFGEKNICDKSYENFNIKSNWKKQRKSVLVNTSKKSIRDIFTSAIKNNKSNSKKGIISLQKVGFEEEKPIFLEKVLNKSNEPKYKNKKTNVENISKTSKKDIRDIKLKFDIPKLNFDNMGDNTNIEYLKKLANQQRDQNKTKLDANFDKTDFYLLSLRHILEKEKIYMNINKKLARIKTFNISVFNDNINHYNRGLKKSNDNYLSQIKTYDRKRINIIICDDEMDVARAAEEIVKKYYKGQGNNPHVYYTKNGIECLYLIYKLSIIERQSIKFILMDVEMDILDGITTCNIIKDNKALYQKVFLLSGDPKDCKADGYCSKPLTEADLKRITNI